MIKLIIKSILEFSALTVVVAMLEFSNIGDDDANLLILLLYLFLVLRFRFLHQVFNQKEK